MRLHYQARFAHSDVGGTTNRVAMYVKNMRSSAWRSDSLSQVARLEKGFEYVIFGRTIEYHSFDKLLKTQSRNIFSNSRARLFA